MPKQAARRVAIEARVVPEGAGGTQQVVIGLAVGLSALTDSREEEYLFLCDDTTREWLAEYLAGPARVLPAPPLEPHTFAQRIRCAVRDPARTWRRLPGLRDRVPSRPRRSDGTAQSAGAALLHYPFQTASLTELPSIYHPHDLQHLHLPEFFTASAIREREHFYRLHCQRASMVAVASSWSKRDLIAHYHLPEDKVAVVPLAPATAAYPEVQATDLAAIRARYGLPDEFLFYPAQTWPHKNHARAIEALALLRKRGRVAHLVCSGYREPEHHPTLVKLAEALGVSDQVHFLGFVSPLELEGLYRMARAVVIPTLFEAGSFPMWEAQRAGAPVACSRVTSLPDQGGDSVLLFDPLSVEAIADAIARLQTEEDLRMTLIQRGTANTRRFSWDRTARIFRAHYRRILGWDRTGEDEALLSAEPIM